jgi:ubiquinone/menaquinone biosynthesis C-methylase UbiE
MTQTTIGMEAPRRSTMTRLEKRFVNSERKSRAVAGRLNDMLERVAPQPGSRYLDVGSGNGAATIEVAAQWQLEATGVDLDPRQIALARGRADGWPASFVEADARRLPFADGTFDLVTSSKATHHIPEWEDALAEMCRVLRPGGHLVYTDLALPRPLAWVAGRWGGDLPPTRAALDTASERLGLTVLSRRTSPFVYDTVLHKP